MKKRMTKKAGIDVSVLVSWGIALLILVVIGGGAYLILSGKAGDALEYVSNLLRLRK